MCGSLYFTFTTSSYPYAFNNTSYKHFSKTNSTDPRQRVPLTMFVVGVKQESMLMPAAGLNKTVTVSMLVAAISNKTVITPMSRAGLNETTTV